MDPGKIEEWGLDPLELKKRHPELIVTRISGQAPPEHLKSIYYCLCRYVRGSESSRAAAMARPDPCRDATALHQCARPSEASAILMASLVSNVKHRSTAKFTSSLLELLIELLQTGWRLPP